MTDASRVLLDGPTIESFETGLRGTLCRPGDDRYETARRIHNGMIDRRPALVACCAGPADVMRAVNFARDRHLPLSVRSGGHGVAGFAVCDGGLMIDLSAMKSVRVDPARRVVRAEAGATWGDLDHETQAFGLATTGGIVRTTGIAGLTLAGGHGFLMRQHGLACDNLLSADVVTADGRFVVASPTDDADLFWALRGGGGNFGVVTSFEYRLHPVDMMFGGLLMHPFADAKEVLRGYDRFTTTSPDELGSLAVLGTLPDGTPATILLLAYNGPADQGEPVVRPLRALAKPMADQLGTLPYVGLQSIVENFNPPGLRNFWKASYLNELDDAAIETIVEAYRRVPSPYTHIVLYTLGGAVSRVNLHETAVSYREARHALVIIGIWTDSSEDDANIAWVRDLWRAMQPYSSGGFYVNYEAESAGDQVRLAYGEQKYNRLVALKSRYDPTNLFCLNQNIQPAERFDGGGA